MVAAGSGLLGLDIRDLATAEARLVPAMRYTPRGNVTAARRVFGGIETALRDARGKTHRLPRLLLLGGEVRHEIPLTVSFSVRPPGIDPGEATPTAVAGHCARMIARHGSTVSLAEEVQMIRELRAAISDRPSQLDANGGWTMPRARDAPARPGAFGICWFEEPCGTDEELADMRRHFPIACFAHASDLPKAMTLRRPDAIVTRIDEHGGIRRTVEFIRACQAMGVGFRCHSGETGIASAADLHLSAALDHVRGASQTLFHRYDDDVIEGGPFAGDTRVTRVPTGPGLGVTLAPRGIAALSRPFSGRGQVSDRAGRQLSQRLRRTLTCKPAAHRRERRS